MANKVMIKKAIRMEVNLIKEIEARARNENRTFSNMVRTILLHQIKLT